MHGLLQDLVRRSDHKSLISDLPPVDLHSNLGVLSSPMTTGLFFIYFWLPDRLRNLGANDLTSKHGPVLPWLRSIDGFDTHDDSFELAIAGGVTSALILPGSANAIGNFIQGRFRSKMIDQFSRWTGIHDQTAENCRKVTFLHDCRASA